MSGLREQVREAGAPVQRHCRVGVPLVRQTASGTGAVDFRRSCQRRLEERIGVGVPKRPLQQSGHVRDELGPAASAGRLSHNQSLALRNRRQSSVSPRFFPKLVRERYPETAEPNSFRTYPDSGKSQCSRPLRIPDTVVRSSRNQCAHRRVVVGTAARTSNTRSHLASFYLLTG